MKIAASSPPRSGPEKEDGAYGESIALAVPIINKRTAAASLSLAKDSTYLRADVLQT